MTAPHPTHLTDLTDDDAHFPEYEPGRYRTPTPDLIIAVEFMHGERYEVARERFPGTYRDVLRPVDPHSEGKRFLLGADNRPGTYLCYWHGERDTTGELAYIGQENIVLSHAYHTLANAIRGQQLWRGVPCPEHGLVPGEGVPAEVTIAYLVENYGIQPTNCLACALDGLSELAEAYANSGELFYEEVA